MELLKHVFILVDTPHSYVKLQFYKILNDAQGAVKSNYCSVIVSNFIVHVICPWMP